MIPPRKKVLRIISFFLFFVFFFSSIGFPIETARADLITYSIPWASSAEGFTWVSTSCTGTCTQGFTASDGNPAGSIFTKVTGRSKQNAGYWKKQLTWEQMGIPAGATVNYIDGRFDVKLAQETHAATQSVGLQLFDSADTTTVLVGGLSYVETAFDPTSSAWATRATDSSKEIDTAYQASTATVTIRMQTDVNSGNNSSAATEVRVDNIVLDITYTPVPSSTVTVSTSGTQTTALNSGDISQYIGAAFTFQQNTGTADTITSLTVTETNSVVANAEFSTTTLLRYENGVSSCTYHGTETATAGTSFNASEKAVFTGISIPVSLSPNFTCVYVIFDLVSSSTYPKGGAAIDFEITGSTDFTFSGGSAKSGTFPLALSGSTTVLPNAVSYSNSTEPGITDGGRSGQSITVNGYGFGSPTAGADREDCTTGAINKGCVKFIAGGTTNILNANITAWSNTSVSFTQSTTLSTFGGVGALEMRAGGQADATPLTFYVYPSISSLTVPTALADAARESDNITINGDHFDSSTNQGGVTFNGGGGAATIVSWSDTGVTVTVPTAITDSTNFPLDITLTRSAVTGSKSATKNNFRVLPKATSTSPVNLKGARADTITISGNHFCQTGTCPGSFSSADKVTFAAGTSTVDVASGVSVWSHTSVPSIIIPSIATDGTTTITSDTSYTSNTLNYDIKFKPTFISGTRAPASGATNVSINPALTGDAFSDSGDNDAFVETQWQIAHNSDTDWNSAEWTATTTGTSTTVNDTIGTFNNGDLGQSSLDCGTPYKWRYRYKDNGGVTNAEWSDYVSDWTFTTASCGPDATSLTNNIEGALTDGARIGQSVTLTGTNFGTVLDGSQANCTGGSGIGCIKIGGTGGYILADTDISSWSNTSITFTLPSGVTGYGGDTTNGLIVYTASVSDTNGLTFHIYPDITSLTAPLGGNTGAREYAATDSDGVITIIGNKFGESPTGNSITIVGASATSFVADGTCDPVDGWADTCVKVQVPATISDTTDSGYVILSRSSKATLSNDPGGALTIWPRVTGISSAQFSDGGDEASTFTVNGNHFGGTSNTLTVNGAAQDGTMTWTASSISGVGVPLNGTDSGNIVVTRSDTKTSNNWGSFYIYPRITGFSAAKGDGDVQSGTTTISGNHFGSSGTTTDIFMNSINPSSFSSWSATSISGVDIPDSGTDSGFITVRNPQTLKVSANSATLYIYPQVTSGIWPTAEAKAAREYSSDDSDGVITLIGNHFGASGTTTVLSITAFQQTTGGCSGSAYQATCVGLQVPASIPDTTNTADILLTRASDGKNDTYSGFRVLPRIISNTPTSGLLGERIKITGNHFCQSGSCPTTNRSTTTDNVQFGGTQAPDSDFVNSGGAPCSGNAQAWTDTEICIQVPVATASGSQPTKVTSGASSIGYLSNTKSFTRSSTVPNDPDVGPGTDKGQYRSNASTALSIGGGTNETTVIFKMSMSAPVNATLIPQVEVKSTATSFDGNLLTEGPSVSYTGTPVTGVVTVSLLSNGVNYHWRARVKNSSSQETSGWVSFDSGNPETATDFYVNTSLPALSTPTASTNDVSGTLQWSTSVAADSSVNYGTSTCLTGTTITNASPVTNHTLTISNLASATTYYYRVKSTDPNGNTGYQPATVGSDPANCHSFATLAPSVRVTKSTDFFIFQDTTNSIPSGTTTQSFNVFASEYDSGNSRDVVLQSAYVDVSGVGVSSSSYSIMVKVNNQASETYTLPASGTGSPPPASPFDVLYKVSSLNYDYRGDTSASNTLEISFPTPPSGTGAGIAVLKARLIFTYSYK